jgi:hypothetical protein
MLGHQENNRKRPAPALCSSRIVSRRGHPSRLPEGSLRSAWTGPDRAAGGVPDTRKGQAQSVRGDNRDMDRNACNQYLRDVREEYVLAPKHRKTQLLDEAQMRTGLARKVIIRKLRKPSKLIQKAPAPRRRRYDQAVADALVELWKQFDFPAANVWLRFYGSRSRACWLAASGVARPRWRTNSKASPPRPSIVCWPANGAGCGSFLWTLSVVDIATGWWQGQALIDRTAQATRMALDRIHRQLPFRIRELHPDNDSSIINRLLIDYCRKCQIALSRSRPLKKNDNCWVEQKNWTHVRKLVGYHRPPANWNAVCCRTCTGCGAYGATSFSP